MSLLIAYSSLSAHHSYIHPIFEGKELSTLQGYLQIISAVFFFFFFLLQIATTTVDGCQFIFAIWNVLKLKNGNFVVNKTNRAFSSLPIDQAHEQNNKMDNGDGGAISLTESSTQLLRWMVSRPGMSRIINDFELCEELVRNIAKQKEQAYLRHHEPLKGVENTYRNQVNVVCSTIEEMGKPLHRPNWRLVCARHP